MHFPLVFGYFLLFLYHTMTRQVLARTAEIDLKHADSQYDTFTTKRYWLQTFYNNYSYSLYLVTYRCNTTEILEGTVDIYHTQQHGTSKICGICHEVSQLLCSLIILVNISTAKCMT